MEHQTAKHFSIQLGSLISLYTAIAFLLTLLFGIITLHFPAESDAYYEHSGATDSVRLGIALVVVFFPTYLLLTRLANKARRASSENTMYVGLTKWLVYLSLLVGGLVLLVDLATTIMTYLNGDLTLRFALKALSVLVVTGAAFSYYLADVRGVWIVRERASIWCGVAASIMVFGAIVGGLLLIDSPTEMRERKIDNSQLETLSKIQAAVVDYVQINGQLPQALSDLKSESDKHDAPKGRAAYEYNLTDNGFSLCAEFALPSIDGENYYTYWGDSAGILNGDDWEHPAGRHCFDRPVNINVITEKTNPAPVLR